MRKLNNWFFINVVVLCCCFSCTKPPERPLNVVFILADDFGVNDVSYNDPDFYETPNIDGLAADGTIFTNGYAAAPVCSPSRASIMLGKTTASHGITDWIGARWGEDWGARHPYTRLAPPSYRMKLDTAQQSLAELFKTGGYKTFFAGKWHLGPDDSWPDDHGFDINQGGWDSGSPNGGYFSPYQNPNLSNGEPGENLSMRLAEETVSFIQSNQDQSFFAFLSFYAVHGPIQTSEQKWRKYREKAVNNGVAPLGFNMERRLPIRLHQDNPIYAGLIEQMDDAIGLVVEALKQQGLYENTIIVFTSDNGGVASGDAFSTSNRPFRGGKGYQWEGGIRVPYLIKAPGKAGNTVDYPVSGQDFFLTLADWCNLPVANAGELDGVNLAPLWQDDQLPNRPLFWHYPHYGNQGGDPASMVRSGDLKLIYYWETETAELYDLSTDIGEQRNIAGSRPEVVQALQLQLFDHLTSAEVPYPEKNTAFSAAALADREKYMLTELGPRLEAQRTLQLSADFTPNATWWGSQIAD